MPTVRTGVWLFPAGAAADLVAAAVRAEELGLDEFWLGDEGPAREPFAVLAAAATATRRITLAVGITNPYVRVPGLAATTALTIAELAGGAERVILGLGAGGSLSLEPFGLEARHPLRRVREALGTMRAVCAGEAGDGFQPAEHGLHGHLALYIGSRSEGLNRLASARADGAFVAGLPPFRYGEVLEWCRSVRPIEIALYPSVAFSPEDIEESRPQMLWALRDAPLAIRRAVGADEDELAAASAALAEGDDGPARRLMTDDRLDQVMLTGPPEAVGRRLADLVRRHRPNAIGLALLQGDAGRAIEAAARSVAVMRDELGPT